MGRTYRSEERGRGFHRRDLRGRNGYDGLGMLVMDPGSGSDAFPNGFAQPGASRGSSVEGPRAASATSPVASTEPNAGPTTTVTAEEPSPAAASEPPLPRAELLNAAWRRRQELAALEAAADAASSPEEVDLAYAAFLAADAQYERDFPTDVLNETQARWKISKTSDASAAAGSAAPVVQDMVAAHVPVDAGRDTAATEPDPATASAVPIAGDSTSELVVLAENPPGEDVVDPAEVVTGEAGNPAPPPTLPEVQFVFHALRHGYEVFITCLDVDARLSGRRFRQAVENSVRELWRVGRHYLRYPAELRRLAEIEEANLNDSLLRDEQVRDRPRVPAGRGNARNAPKPSGSAASPTKAAGTPSATQIAPGSSPVGRASTPAAPVAEATPSTPSAPVLQPALANDVQVSGGSAGTAVITPLSPSPTESVSASSPSAPAATTSSLPVASAQPPVEDAPELVTTVALAAVTEDPLPTPAMPLLVAGDTLEYLRLRYEQLAGAVAKKELAMRLARRTVDQLYADGHFQRSEEASVDFDQAKAEWNAARAIRDRAKMELEAALRAAPDGFTVIVAQDGSPGLRS